MNGMKASTQSIFRRQKTPFHQRLETLSLLPRSTTPPSCLATQKDRATTSAFCCAQDISAPTSQGRLLNLCFRDPAPLLPRTTTASRRIMTSFSGPSSHAHSSTAFVPTSMRSTGIGSRALWEDANRWQDPSPWCQSKIACKKR